MTREEAISLLTQVNKILVNSNSWLENTHEPLNMAFDMAIKALEQEPTKNDLGVDCISREKAIDAFPDLLPNMGYSKKAITEILQKVPPVTPIRPKGHWIYHREEDYKCCEHWECSNCHKSTMTNPMYEKNDYDHMYYCPKCGSKMVESQESEDKE